MRCLDLDTILTLVEAACYFVFPSILPQPWF